MLAVVCSDDLSVEHVRAGDFFLLWICSIRFIVPFYPWPLHYYSISISDTSSMLLCCVWWIVSSLLVSVTVQGHSSALYRRSTKLSLRSLKLALKNFKILLWFEGPIISICTFTLLTIKAWQCLGQELPAGLLTQTLLAFTTDGSVINNNYCYSLVENENDRLLDPHSRYLCISVPYQSWESRLKKSVWVN